MKIPVWLKVIGSFLLGVLGAIAAIIFTRRPAGPTPADSAVTAADAEKKKIADDIAADSSAGLADRFNKLAEKMEKKP